MQARGGRQSRAGGYFNRARGEVWNYHQVLGCVTEQVNECLGNTAETPPTPFFPSSTPGLSDEWPISCPQGIKPLHAVIAFADPIADPIGSWENDINWWSNPITAEFREQVTFVLRWSSYGSR